MDPHTWPCKSRTTNTNIHSATMWGYRMLSRRPTWGDERYGKVAREGQGYPRYQHDMMMMMIYIYIYIYIYKGHCLVLNWVWTKIIWTSKIFVLRLFKMVENQAWTEVCHWIFVCQKTVYKWAWIKSTIHGLKTHLL